MSNQFSMFAREWGHRYGGTETRYDPIDKYQVYIIIDFSMS